MNKKQSQSQGGAYAVGYKRPPIGSRFQKGQSGNPRGRPKRTADINDTIRNTLLKPVTVRENGVSRRIPALAALAARAVNEALQGRAKLFVDLFKLLQSAGLLSLADLRQPPIDIMQHQIRVRIVRPDGREQDLAEYRQDRSRNRERGSGSPD